MRIAVFEPDLRTAGVTAYAFHTAAGLRAAGADADVVSFTRSGRNRKVVGPQGDRVLRGWHWWTEVPDVIERWDDAPEVLRGYDLVYLIEPKHGTQDRAGLREAKLPEYIKAMWRARVPWTSALHAPLYRGKLAPFLETMMRVPGFTGTMIAHQEDCGEGVDALASVNLAAYPWVPYRMRLDDDAPPAGEGLPVAGTMGRFTPNKGGPTVAVCWDSAAEGWHLRLRGAESGGMGASPSYLTYKLMVQCAGWKGERTGNPSNSKHDPGLNNYGDLISSFPWWLEKDGRYVTYDGGFTDAIEVARQFTLAFCLTSPKFARGFELTALECLDAGCALVVPETTMHAEPPLRVGRLEHFVNTVPVTGKTLVNKFPGGAESEGELRTTIQRLTNFLSTAEGQAWHAEVAVHNRKTVRELHSPRRFGQFLLELVGTPAPLGPPPPHEESPPEPEPVNAEPEVVDTQLEELLTAPVPEEAPHTPTPAFAEYPSNEPAQEAVMTEQVHGDGSGEALPPATNEEREASGTHTEFVIAKIEGGWQLRVNGQPEDEAVKDRELLVKAARARAQGLRPASAVVIVQGRDGSEKARWSYGKKVTT